MVLTTCSCLFGAPGFKAWLCLCARKCVCVCVCVLDGDCCPCCCRRVQFAGGRRPGLLFRVCYEGLSFPLVCLNPKSKTARV